MKEALKFLFYRIVCPVLLFLGIDRFLRRISKNKRLIIMYHGVIRDSRIAINARHMPVDDFEKQLIYLKANFQILSLTEICEMKVKGIQSERHSIALTFDDGFLNNYSNALPLLRRYNVPATFFISSASLTEEGYIHPADYLDLINFFIDDQTEINGEVFRKGRYHLANIEKTKPGIYEYMDSLSFPLWKKTLSHLQLKYPRERITQKVHDEAYRLITAATFKDLLDEDLITIGSHGHWHLNLTSLSEMDMKDQLGRSIQLFSEHGLNRVETLAFPSGNFNEKVISVSRELGFRYLIAAGSLSGEDTNQGFPRIGILNLAGVAYNILSVNRGFNRFGF